MFLKTTLIAILAIASAANAQEITCKGNPKLVAPCYETRGRVQIYNGTPGMRMWKVGTNRILGIVPSEAEIIPENLKEHIGLSILIFGDFVVCPFTEERTGWMQMVCVESAKNLRVEDYSQYGNDPIITEIPNE